MNTKSFFSFMLCSIGLLAHNTEGWANTWAQKASFGVAKRFGSAGFAIGEKVYVGTGHILQYLADVGAPQNDFWEYDPATDTWTQKADFAGLSRMSAVGFAIGDKGYITTGAHPDFDSEHYYWPLGVGFPATFLKDTWEYDPIANTWTQRSDFGGPGRAEAVAFTIGDRGYVGSGTGNDFYAYDPTTDSWVQTASLGGGERHRAVGFSMGNKGYVAAGYGSTSEPLDLLRDFWEFDPAYNTWTRKADFGGLPRYDAVGFSIGSRCFVGAGMVNPIDLQSAFPVTDLWEYIPANNTWLQRADVPGNFPDIVFTSGSRAYSLSRATATDPCQLWEYDPTSTNTWTQKPPFGGTGRTAAVGFSIGTKGYITTGNDGFIFDNPLNDLWVFDQATGAWNQKADLPGPARMWATGFAIGGKGYVGTGCDAGLTNHVLNDFWEYDPVQNNWTQKADLPGAARQKAIGFAAGGKGYIGTGLSTTDLKDLWEYDPATDAWTQRPDLPGAARRYAIGLAIGPKGYVGAGSSFSGVLETDPGHIASHADFWEYDPATTTWTQRTDVGAIHEKGVGFSIGLKGYVGTGGYGFFAHDDFKEYDPASDSWSVMSVYNGGPCGAAVGFSIGTKGYIGTGYDDLGVRRNDFWEYDTGLLCLPGTACDDGDACTSNDAFNGSCACVGTPAQDTDGDGICDPNDPCDNTFEGLACDDGNPFTAGDALTNCSCVGTPTTGYWTVMADVPGPARNGAVGFSIAGIGYIGTGNNGGLLKDLWAYDPTTNAWSQRADLPGAPRDGAVGFSIGNIGYIGTGRLTTSLAETTGDLAHDFYAYDPLTNAWLQKADFPWDWKNATGFSAGGQGYITTGTTYGGGNYSSVLVAYDPAANTWTSRAPLPGNARIYATAFTIGNTGHVFGGFGGSGALNDLWAYDPTVDLWTSKAALPAIGRGLSSAFALGSVGIVAGGVAETPLNEVWQYNSTTNAWFARSPMVNGARSSAVAFSIGQHGYVGTGYDANLVRTGTFERYTTLEHDCVGVPGGETTPGSSCDDGIASTTDDVYGNDCVCAGIPGTNVWRPRADFAGQGRAFAVSFSIGTKGYVGTGYNGTPLADFWEFDPATNAWTQKADLPGGARERAAGFSIGAKGYIGTGLTGINTMFDDFWEFDPASNIWTQKATFPGGVRQYAVGFSIGSKGYLGLGTAFTLYPTDLYVYDPAIDSWSATSNAEAFFGGVGIGGAATFTVDGVAYIGGGFYSGSYLDMFHAYDPATDLWSNVASFPPGGRALSVAMTIGNKGYVGTGVGAGSGNDFWKYDPLTNQWTQRADVPGTPRLGAFGFSMAGKGYLGGGRSGSSGPYLLDFHEYRDYDCFGIAGGDAHPGTACDDGDECTEGDVLAADCTCAGTVLDTDGDGDCDAIDPCPLQMYVINGNGCDDGNPCTVDDIVVDCACTGTWLPDADGDGLCDDQDNCPNIFGQIGEACNGGIGMISNACVCVSACTEIVTVELRTDANSLQASWQVLAQNTNTVLCQYSVPVNGITGPIPQDCCLPVGCYRLRVTDSGGDGFVSGGTTGGYVLRESNGSQRRIIDNTANFTDLPGGPQDVSAVASTYENGAFCVPIGGSKPVFQHCDKLDWPNDQTTALIAAEDPLVSASWNATTPPTDKGYEFWWFDPNGTYSFRRFRSHSASDGYSPANATRACKAKINGWSNTPTSPWLTVGKLYNVRIRARYGATNYSPFGPACQFKINPAAAACPLVKLQDNPANTADYSCGVIRQFGGSNNAGINMNSALPGSAANWGNKLVANPPQPIPAVASANVRYQFRFVNPGEVPNGTIVRPMQTSPTIYLNWTTGAKLKCGVTYDVSVRVSLDGGATWCVGGNVSTPAVLEAQSPLAYWGTVCQVSIRMNNNAPCPVGPLNGGSSNMAPEISTGNFTLYPNPNRGDQLFIALSEVPADVNMVSVSLFDLAGQQVIARTIPAQDGYLKTTLDLHGELSGGMYLVHITAGDRTYTERLVIQP